MMKPVLAACALLSLTACASVTGANQTEALKALQAIASDPNCGHTDRIQGDIGGLGSGLHVFLERTCPAKAPQ